MNQSELGRQLQKLSRGIPKTMTPAALKQRREASQKAAAKRKTKPKAK